VVAHTIVRRCGEVARDRGLARQLSTSGRRPRSHSTFSLGIFHAEASSQILREAIGIMPTQAFSRAARGDASGSAVSCWGVPPFLTPEEQHTANPDLCPITGNSLPCAPSPRALTDLIPNRPGELREE
jgi:hypothetical protein